MVIILVSDAGNRIASARLACRTEPVRPSTTIAAYREVGVSNGATFSALEVVHADKTASATRSAGRRGVNAKIVGLKL